MNWTPALKKHGHVLLAFLAGAAWLLGVVAVFLPWYGWSTAVFGVQLSANGLSSSMTVGAGPTNTVGWAPLNLLFIIGIVLGGVGCYQAIPWGAAGGQGPSRWARLLLAGSVLELLGVIGYVLAASSAIAAKGASPFFAVQGGAILAIVTSLVAAGLTGWDLGWDRVIAQRTSYAPPT